MDIYFSDYFSISPEILNKYGAFDISLVSDLPLFVDPFLLFNSKNQTYQRLHAEIIKYMRFLKDVSVEEDIPEALLREWFTFPEIEENWLGFSDIGNKGHGLGPGFAHILRVNFRKVFRDFGEESITQSSHIEKLCLIKKGVGRDNLSDFTTNLIVNFLAEYTQKFALKHLKPRQRGSFQLRKVKFNYDTRSWETKLFELPSIEENKYILLTPKDILTKDESWINRNDLINKLPEIANALPNATLRAQVNDYLAREIPKDREAKKKEIREAIASTIEQFPEVLDYYILNKEESGDEAISSANAKVQQVQSIFIDHIRKFVSRHLDPGGFYKLPYETYEEAYKRVLFLKDTIENKGGHKLFYFNGHPIEREKDLQIMYRLTWFATPSDVTREANDGRGPADFKISRGAKDKTIVEFKLAKNTQLERNLQKQCEVYEAASDTTNPSIKVILYFDDAQYSRVQEILKKLGLEGDRNVILIDACDDNKPSGSRA